MNTQSNGDLEQDLVARAYERWAPIYDMLCGPILAAGRRAAARAASVIGGTVLEIGVGTGLSFPHYSRSVNLFGIDISEQMLAHARRRALSGHYPAVRELYVMDAHTLDFPDHSFNCVVAPFVITLVQEPERVLSEALRVLKPGGQLIVVSHFCSDSRMAAAAERWMARHTKSWGLRPDFPLERVERWAQGHGQAEALYWKQIALGSYTLVRIPRSTSVTCTIRGRSAAGASQY